MKSKIKKIMERNRAEGARMSGSGPTVFGIFRREQDARMACEELEKSGMVKDVFLTRPCPGTVTMQEVYA